MWVTECDDTKVCIHVEAGQSSKQAYATKPIEVRKKENNFQTKLEVEQDEWLFGSPPPWPC